MKQQMAKWVRQTGNDKVSRNATNLLDECVQGRIVSVSQAAGKHALSHIYT